MKIRKFNESSKSYTEEKIQNILLDSKLLMDKLYMYFIYKLPEIDKELDSGEVKIKDSFFLDNGDFVINYSTNYDFNNSYYVDDIDEMIKFLNNPEVFRKSKKYNL